MNYKVMNRPMFKMGGTPNEGIMHGLVKRQGYDNGGQAEKYADEDKQTREVIETRNQAESFIYATDKAIKDLGEKVDDNIKNSVEESKEKLKEAMKEDDLEPMQKAFEEFQQASQAVAEMAYQQAEEERAKNETPDENSGENSDSKDDDNVVDVDYEEVEEEK
mgnify:CR=1 FL=1